MPGPLKNRRHEHFCWELVKTKSLKGAYLAAGYKATASSADKLGSRLAKKMEVATRLAELQSANAVYVQITVNSLCEELEQARIAAMHAEVPQTSAAVAASLAKAKLLGLVVDKREVGSAGEFSQETDEALMERLREKSQALGVPMPDLPQAPSTDKLQ